MYGYIYKTTNLVNNMIYIGQKKSMNLITTYFGSGLYICRAVKKYSRSCFKVELIAEGYDRKALDILEKYYIKTYERLVGKDMMYNLAAGGHGHHGLGHPAWNKGIPRTEECKEKIRLANKLFPHSHRRSGWHHTPEALKKIGLKSLGRQTFLGRQHTLDSIQKMSRTKKGKPAWNKGLTKETNASVAKQSKTQTGRLFSLEHKANISLARRRIYGNYVSSVK